MAEGAATPAVLDYERASADFKRYLPLKLATLAWFVIALGAGTYGMAATWSEWWPYPALDISNLDEAKPAIYSFFSGLIGGTVYVLRGFYWAVGPQSDTNRRYQFDPNWTLWRVIRPIMGAFLGVFTFMLLRAGVGTLGTATTDGGSSAAYSAVAFLAGFSVTEVLNWLTVSARRVFSVGDIPEGSPRRQRSSGAEDENHG